MQYSELLIKLAEANNKAGNVWNSKEVRGILVNLSKESSDAIKDLESKLHDSECEVLIWKSLAERAMGLNGNGR